MAFTVPRWCKGKFGARVSNRPRTAEGIHLLVSTMQRNASPPEGRTDRYHSANPTVLIPHEDTHWETTGISRDPLALTDMEAQEEHSGNLHIKPLKIHPAMRVMDDKQFDILEGTRFTDPTLETVLMKEETVKRNQEIDMEGHLMHHCILPSCQGIVVPPQTLVEDRKVDANIVVSKEIRQQKVSFEKHGSSSKQAAQNHSLDALRCVKRETVNTSVTKQATRPSRSARQMVDEKTQQALCAGFELFDYNRDGLISRTDFLHVLHEFGFTIAKDELDNLLSRSVSWKPLPQVNTYATPLFDQHVQAAKPLKDHKLKSPRVLFEIEALLCNVLKERINMFTQHFKYMTQKQYGRIDRLQFGRVLRLCSVLLLECELDQLWISLPTDDQNMLTVSALLDHFLISRASSKKVSEQDPHANGIVTKKSYGQMNATMKNRNGGFTCGRDKNENQNSKTNTYTHTRLHYLCGKVKLQVQSQRDYLMTYFHTRDRMGLSHIAKTEMKVLMDKLYFNLSSQEKEELCQMFDFHNRGRFYYMPFMESTGAVMESNVTSTTVFS
ncbi:EF-hand calcium-binding domain-containing protein 6-like isoform X2 [Haliotis asinina]|uniref:EF-hand calcium-binding domain-containing protein 6-like isoform X2 n=1 Tax=Haliotis asinina TaxID=109174 RepID=UPI003531AF2D